MTLCTRARDKRWCQSEAAAKLERRAAGREEVEVERISNPDAAHEIPEVFSGSPLLHFFPPGGAVDAELVE